MNAIVLLIGITIGALLNEIFARKIALMKWVKKR